MKMTKRWESFRNIDREERKKEKKWSKFLEHKQSEKQNLCLFLTTPSFVDKFLLFIERSSLSPSSRSMDIEGAQKKELRVIDKYRPYCWYWQIYVISLALSCWVCYLTGDQLPYRPAPKTGLEPAVLEQTFYLSEDEHTSLPRGPIWLFISY